MTVDLPPLEALIRARVESGRYGDAPAVIDAALRLLDERDRIECLRRLVVDAEAEVERGEVVDWTPEFFDRLKREAADASRDNVPVHDDVRP